MPTYLYECEEGHEFELSQEINDKPLEECNRAVDQGGNTNAIRRCKSPCKRLINNEGGFSLKGTGWTPKHFG